MPVTNQRGNASDTLPNMGHHHLTSHQWNSCFGKRNINVTVCVWVGSWYLASTIKPNSHGSQGPQQELVFVTFDSIEWAYSREGRLPLGMEAEQSTNINHHERIFRILRGGVKLNVENYLPDAQELTSLPKAEHLYRMYCWISASSCSLSTLVTFPPTHTFSWDTEAIFQN